MFQQHHSGLRAALFAALALTVAGGLTGCTTDSGAPSDPPGPDVVVPDQECGYDAECDGLIEVGTCEVARCDAGACVAAPAPTWALCDAPSAGECERGACNEAGSCVVVTAEDGQGCDLDGWNSCDSYTCQAGACTASPLVICDDGDACTDDTCDPATGDCSFTGNSSDCDDLNPCTVDDVCTPDGCQGDNLLCQCSVDDDCLEFDADKCDGYLVCDNGQCVDAGVEPVTCEASGDPCMDNACNPVSGACEMVDNGTCQCSQDSDCAAFEDDDLCNGTLECDTETFQCVPVEGSIVVCDGGQVGCMADTCNPATGQCEMAPLADLQPCDDGDPCTGCGPDDPDCAQFDFCLSGTCEAGNGSPCECDGLGDCAAFDDGDLCNGSWACVEGTCTFDDTVVDCTGQLTPACQEAACNPATGTCESSDVDDATPCDDGDACTTGETCTAGVCGGGTPVGGEGCDPEPSCGDGICQAPADPTTYELLIEDFAFVPETQALVVGDSVTWTNLDGAPHTATSTAVPDGASAFDTGELGSNEFATVTFTVAGTYEYQCTIHPSMTGTLIVGEAPYSETAATCAADCTDL